MYHSKVITFWINIKKEKVFIIICYNIGADGNASSFLSLYSKYSTSSRGNKTEGREIGEKEEREKQLKKK